MEFKELCQKAIQAAQQAYAPKSHFPVGACLLTENNHYYSGCNVENACFPLGQCAEATAIGHMILHGEQTIKAAAIVATEQDFCPPCGACRQRLAEFMAPEGKIVLCRSDISEIKVYTLDELLPHAFMF